MFQYNPIQVARNAFIDNGNSRFTQETLRKLTLSDEQVPSVTTNCFLIQLEGVAMLISEKHPRIIVDDKCGVAGYWPYAVNVIYLLNGVYLSEDENTTVIKRLVDYKQKLREYQDDEEAFARTEFVVHCNPPPCLVWRTITMAV